MQQNRLKLVQSVKNDTKTVRFVLICMNSLHTPLQSTLFNLNLLKWYKTEPNGDGTGAYYNEKGVFDTNKKDHHTVVCVQKIACK